MIATHKHRKSGALVTYVREFADRVEFREGAKARRLPVARWINAYEALPVDMEHILPPPVTLQRPPNYGPRKVDEAAMQRQNLKVPMSIRKHQTRADKDCLARAARIPFCCWCGATGPRLDVAHAPPGIVSQGMGGKTSDRLVTRLCAGGRETCHETIDLHVEPDWKERWLTAFARGEAWLHDNDKRAA